MILHKTMKDIPDSNANDALLSRKTKRKDEDKTTFKYHYLKKPSIMLMTVTKRMLV